MLCLGDDVLTIQPPQPSSCTVTLATRAGLPGKVNRTIRVSLLCSRSRFSARAFASPASATLAEISRHCPVFSEPSE